MSDIDWGILRPSTNFVPPEGGIGGAIVKGISTGADINLKNAQAQEQQSEVPLHQAQARAQDADSTYKQHLALQADATTALTNIQATAAKAGLVNDIFAAVNNEQTYQNAKKSAQQLGLDTSDAPDHFDPTYVAQKQAMSQHYLDAVKAEGDLAMKQLNAQLQASQLNIQAITKNLPPVINTSGLPSVNLPGYGAANPATIGMPQQQAQPTQGGSMAGQQPMQGGPAPAQGMPQAGLPQASQVPPQVAGNRPSLPQPAQMQTAPQGAPLMVPGAASQGAPSAALSMGNPGGFAGSLSQAEAGGKETAQLSADFDKQILNQGKVANNTLIDVGLARDALSKGITPGRFTGVFREWLTPGASQQLDKASADLLSQTIRSFSGTGAGRMMQSEIQQFMKALPGNLTAAEVNNRILDVVEMKARLDVLQSQALQQIESLGITNPLQKQNILQQTFDQLGVLNYSNGKVNASNLKYYFDALNSTLQGKSIINDDSLAATAKQHNMTIDQVKQLLIKSGKLQQ